MKSKKEKVPETFSAYHYAHEFEKLSLEVVNIIFKEKLTENVITHKSVTKETRDKGVDAYLIFNIKNSSINHTCTVEAKLRTSNVLSLKDFATSILYYLINNSIKHYIVTNVTYSSDAIKCIQRINLDQPKDIELVDGKLLQDTINLHLSDFYNIYSEELVDYIIKKSFPPKIKIPNVSSKCNYYSDKKIVRLTAYKEKLENVKDAIELGYSSFLVMGKRGTGKSFFLEMVIRELGLDHTIYKFDISLLQTPKLFVLEFLRNLLNLDVDAIFSSFATDTKSIDKIMKQLMSYNCCSPEILKGIRMLVSNDYTPEEYIYLFGLLIKHLAENFLFHKKAVILIENLHEANLEMIKFIIDSSRIICNSKMLLFWKLLLPINAHEFGGISPEQWYNYIYLLSENKYNNNISYCITMNDFSKNDLIEIFEEIIPEVKVTDQFIDQFINMFGLLPSNVFLNLHIIKNKGIYSVPALTQFAFDISNYNNYHIKLLYESESPFVGFYKKSLTFTLLLNGRLKYKVMDFLDKHYGMNSHEKLMETGLYREGNGEIVFQNQYLHFLKLIADIREVKSCAAWLLQHIKLIFSNQVEEKYYNSYFSCIIQPDLEIKKINSTIQNFIEQKVYKYALPLAEIRFKYYEMRENSYLHFKYYVSYIEYTQKSNSCSKEKFYSMLQQADLLQINFKLNKTKDYFKTDIQYSLIKYKWAKLNYNYNECEKNIDNILKYENVIREKEIFAMARIYKALIKKERGLRKEFISEMVDNLRKYPNNKNVKVTYYVNIAAMYKHDSKGHGISIAIKLLQTARNITYDPKKAHGDLEVEIGLLNLMSFQDKVNVEQIQEIQLMAEKYNSMQYLAKTF